MKTYRLIKKYPGSPELGAIVNKQSPHNLYMQCIDEPEYWEEIKESEYKILMWSYGRDKFLFSKNPDWSAGEFHIHSVQRLSDGEIFTVGEKCNGDIIKSFKVYDNDTRIYVISENKTWGLDLELLKKDKKPKPVLFVSEDGVEIFENDKVFSIENKPYLIDSILCLTASNKIKELFPRRIFFSTKKAAENYLICHKPCLSFNDVWNISNNKSSDNLYVVIDKRKLKELVKSKI